MQIKDLNVYYDKKPSSIRTNLHVNVWVSENIVTYNKTELHLSGPRASHTGLVPTVVILGTVELGSAQSTPMYPTDNVQICNNLSAATGHFTSLPLFKSE